MAQRRLRLVPSSPAPSRAELVLSRGLLPVYVRGQRNVCPGCGGAGWSIADRGPAVRAECLNDQCGVILPVEATNE